MMPFNPPSRSASADEKVWFDLPVLKGWLCQRPAGLPAGRQVPRGSAPKSGVQGSNPGFNAFY